jgi:TRAP-type C4-dicarboxylate transport system permease small subunit
MVGQQSEVVMGWLISLLWIALGVILFLAGWYLHLPYGWMNVALIISGFAVDIIYVLCVIEDLAERSDRSQYYAEEEKRKRREEV